MKRLNLSSGVLTSIWTLMCFPRLRTSFWLYIFNLLSTPSLGIPRRDRSLSCLPTRRHSFNSLSRDHVIAGAFAYEYLYMKSFQLPLSGSHAFSFSGQTKSPHPLSTPSLGITYIRYTIGIAGGRKFSFNSLSRDHRARFRDFPALRGFLPRHHFAQMISEATIWIYRFAPL